MINRLVRPVVVLVAAGLAGRSPGARTHPSVHEPRNDAPVSPATSTDLQPLADSLRPVVTPISGGLGLAEISAEVGEPAVAGVRAVVLDIDGREMDVALVESTGAAGAGGRRWSARVMTASPDLSYRMVLVDRQGARFEGPPQRASCAPAAEHSTPDWAKGAVWYQVFVERFRNGNPANDPRSPEFFPARWSSDWNTVTIDELELARARAAEQPVPQPLNPRRRGGQLGNVLNTRRYGGDLEGLAEKLDELSDLGVTALYLNPVFEAHSHHKYDASDHRHIDPAFAGPGRSDDEAAALARETADARSWTLTAADRYFIETFIPAVRQRRMRIVLDGVWNHVGVRHWAFRDVLERGVDSRYKDWFICSFADEAEHPDWKQAALDLRPGRLIGWKSWGDRNGGLPEFARDLKSGRLHPEVERYIWDVTRRWTHVTDGWRLDVVPDVPLPFWRAWSDHVRSINPDAALFCEVWFDAKEYFAPPDSSGIGAARVFDGQMNYPFAFAAVRWLAGEPGMTSTKLAVTLGRVFSHGPATDLVQMNLLGSHDTERLASMLNNPGRAYDQEGTRETNHRYDDGRPSAAVYRRVALAAALQALHEGAPMVYNGDEYGMFGADDPHCRKPVPWPDRGPYDDPDSVSESGLREQFRAWLRLRSDPIIGPVLRYGSTRYLVCPNADVLAFERRLNDLSVICVLNRGADTNIADLGVVPPNAVECGPPGGDARILPSLSARAWRSSR